MADLPIGSIVMFDGFTPPAGWHDCDGDNGTPNLIGAFPMGVPSGGTLGATGGSETHVHPNADTGYQTHGHAEATANSGVSTGSSVPKIWAGSAAFGLDEHQHEVSIPAVTGSISHKHPVPDTAPASSMPPNIRLRYIMRCE